MLGAFLYNDEKVKKVNLGHIANSNYEFDQILLKSTEVTLWGLHLLKMRGSGFAKRLSLWHSVKNSRC